MPRGYEFVDEVPEDLPSVINRRLGEGLVPTVARIGENLAETGGTIEISRVQRRLYPIDKEAVIIALREAHDRKQLHLDEVDGIVYPPLNPMRQYSQRSE